MNEPGPVTSADQQASRNVFVSYATADRKDALSVCDAIERRGAQCWISTRDVPPGENYQEAIVRALREARAMVLVFSEAANNSDEIKKELSPASRYHVPVMALRMEDVEPSDAFAYELSTRQWVDAFEGWDRSIDSLMQRIGRLQQAEQVFRIGRRDMTDHVDGEQVVAISVDATDRRHGLQEIHEWASLRKTALVFWNTGNLYLFPSKAL